MPQDWNLPLTNIPTPSWAAQGQAQDKDEAVSCSSSSSRPVSPSPSPSPTKTVGMPPTVPPQMQRGVTEPCTVYSSARSLESPRKEDLAELGREFGSGEVCRTPGTTTPGATPGGKGVEEQQERGASRGRLFALGKSKSVSPKGEWEVGVDVRGQARSASPERDGQRDKGRVSSCSPSPPSWPVSAVS